MKIKVKKQNRRAFFEAGLRYTVLAGLTSMGFIISSRKPIDEVKSNLCVSGGVCSDCSIFSRCTRPEALSRKQVLTKEGNSKQVKNEE
jgi:hypothetical protein